MDFYQNMYQLFREKFNRILDEIESSVYVFIEDLLLSKNFPLETVINYTQDNSYQKICKDLIESIAFALKSLNVPQNQINSGLLRYFPTFSPKPDYKTYVDWINAFKPYIQMILFSETLQYLAELPSNIEHLAEYSILSQRNLSELKTIKKDHPQLVLYLNSFLKFKEVLHNKISTSENDYVSLFNFQDPEKDLQSLYIVFRLLETFRIEEQYQFDKIGAYLINQKENWILQNPNISEKYPMTVYCGIYLARAGNIAIDGNAVKEYLKKCLVNLVNNYKAPIFEDTFLVYYTLLACDALDLKLTGKLITGLIKTDPAIISFDALKRFSTTRLGTIFLIYDHLKIMNELPESVIKSIVQIMDSRCRENVYYDYDIDFMACTEAIYGSLIISEFANILAKYPFLQNLDFVLKSMKENLIVLDFSLTGQVSDLFYGIMFIDRFNSLQNDLPMQIIKSYIFGQPIPTFSPPATPSPILNAEDPFADVPHSFDFDSNESSSPSSSSEKSPMSAKFVPAGVAPVPAPIEPVVSIPKIVIEDEKSAAPSPPVLTSKRDLPVHYWDYFGDFPILIPDIVDELQLNMAAISKPREIIYQSLETLHQWVVSLKILNIDFPFTKEELFQKTAPFRKENGFGFESAEFSDVENTFYGLSIYSEVGLLNRLNLIKINEYLQEEIKNINENFILTNDCIFMALRLLARQKVAMESYANLLPMFATMNFQSSNDQISVVDDMIHYVNLLKSIDSNIDLSFLHENYLKEVQVAQEEDGSIQKVAANTARVLITLKELGLHSGAEGKFMLKYLQYDAKPFSESTQKEPLGWEQDSLGFLVELNMCYWILIGLTMMYPSNPPEYKACVCPECRKYFSKKPKFCNGCGHPF